MTVGTAVYIVLYSHEGTIQGVFATREAADEYIAGLTYARHCWIEEHPVHAASDTTLTAHR